MKLNYDQTRLRKFLKEFERERGIFPSESQIAIAFGYGSRKLVRELVDSMLEAGIIGRFPNGKIYLKSR